MSERSNYAFMKTGLLSERRRIVEDDPFMKRLMGLVIVMVEKAAETAIEFVEHDDRRRQVDRDDVVRALKYQARTFFASEDLETRLADVEARDERRRGSLAFEIRNRTPRPRHSNDDLDLDIGPFDDPPDLPDLPPDLQDPCDDDDDDADDDDGDDPQLECRCPSCEDVRRVEAEWDDWRPTDAAEMFLKRHVDALPSQVPVP